MFKGMANQSVSGMGMRRIDGRLVSGTPIYDNRRITCLPAIANCALGNCDSRLLVTGGGRYRSAAVREAGRIARV